MITKVTPQVSVGDAEDARAATNENFDATLNVAIDLDIEDRGDHTHAVRLRRHKVGMVDGPGNDPLQMVAALILLYWLVTTGKRVLVHCHAGQSRSVMVCAAFLDLTGVSSLDDALAKILPLRKIDMYRPAMYDLATSALPIAKQVINYGKHK